MIGLCFLFGYWLATFEGPVEIAGNHDVIRDWYNDSVIINDFVPSVEKSYKDCLVQFQNESLPTDTLVLFMDNCTKDQVAVQESKAKYLQDKRYEGFKFKDALAFNWVICERNETSGASHNYFQTEKVYKKWEENYKHLKHEYLQNGLASNDAHETAMVEANGSESCVVNVNGASYFWYTIMTTIGYGYTAPVTSSGKMLVYFLGFLSICLFTAIIANAALIGLTIADDFFYRVGLKRLAEGISAVVFWLIMLLLWLLVITCSFVIFHYEILAGEFNLWDSEIRQWAISNGFWLAFISVTTIGFGDYYLEPEVMEVHHMFIVVIFFTVGYIFFANFFFKAGTVIVDWTKSKTKVLDNKMKSFRLDNSKHLD